MWDLITMRVKKKVGVRSKGVRGQGSIIRSQDSGVRSEWVNDWVSEWVADINNQIDYIKIYHMYWV